jgi:hypothetical protein
VSDRRASEDEQSNHNADNNGSTTGNSSSFLRIFHWHNGTSSSASSSRRNSRLSNGGLQAVSTSNQNNEAAITPPGIPDVDVESALNQSYSSTLGQANLSASQGSMNLTEAIKEARRVRPVQRGINSLTAMSGLRQNQKPKPVKPVKPAPAPKIMLDKEINTSPLYYPKLPQSVIEDGSNQEPMAPLQAPWPLLPPLGIDKVRKPSSSSLPTSVRSFLDAQQISNHR